MATSAINALESDEALAAAVGERVRQGPDLRGAHDAYRALYQRHARLLLAFLAARVHPNDVEDVHQAVWERVWQHLPDSFRGGNFKAWLYRIARNYLLDQGRRRPSETVADVEFLADERQGSPVDRLLDQERTRALERCLEKLEDELAALVRARLDGQGYDEICARLGLPLHRAHRLFHSAKEQLQKCVEQALS